MIIVQVIVEIYIFLASKRRIELLVQKMGFVELFDRDIRFL